MSTPWTTMREAQARVTDSLTNGPSDQSLELLTTAIRRIDARTARIVMSPAVVRALRAASDATLGAETFGERYTRRLLAAQRTRYAWIEHQRRTQATHMSTLGWCITGHHSACPGVITIGTTTTCQCHCHTEGADNNGS